jgi:hypothetical protein
MAEGDTVVPTTPPPITAIDHGGMVIIKWCLPVAIRIPLKGTPIRAPSPLAKFMAKWTTQPFFATTGLTKLIKLMALPSLLTLLHPHKLGT